MNWDRPGWLLGLFLVPLAWLASRRAPRLDWPHVRRAPRAPGPLALRTIALAGLVLALARPWTVAGSLPVKSEGVAIVIALDTSSSMAQAVGDSTRLAQAQRAIDDFVSGRPNDPIGLVAFANLPDATCPPTLDHGFLKDLVASLRVVGPGDDGTNLGDAIAWALRDLEDAPTQRSALVLVTDGRNAPGVPGALDPIVAAGMAKARGVVVHAIATGGPGPEGPDVELLETIAKTTGGRAFRAEGPTGLAEVFRALDALERSPVRGERTVLRRSWSEAGLLVAALAIALDLGLSAGPWRRIP